jgi:hypothetical protein
MTEFSQSGALVFKNTMVVMISIWKYGVKIHFDDPPIVITVEGNVEINSNGRSDAYNGQDGVRLGTRILELLDRKAHDVELTLRPDLDPRYECYQVNLPNGLLIGRNP